MGCTCATQQDITALWTSIMYMYCVFIVSLDHLWPYSSIQGLDSNYMYLVSDFA